MKIFKGLINNYKEKRRNEYVKRMKARKEERDKKELKRKEELLKIIDMSRVIGDVLNKKKVINYDLVRDLVFNYVDILKIDNFKKKTIKSPFTDEVEKKLNKKELDLFYTCMVELAPSGYLIEELKDKQ